VHHLVGLAEQPGDVGAGDGGRHDTEVAQRRVAAAQRRQPEVDPALLDAEDEKDVAFWKGRDDDLPK
jgi:hypothetical protein